MLIILPIAAMELGHINAFLPILIGILLWSFYLTDKNNRSQEKVFYSNIKGLAPDVVKRFRVEWHLNRHRAPRLHMQLSCQCDVRIRIQKSGFLILLNSSRWFYKIEFRMVLTYWRTKRLKTRKVMQSEMALRYDFCPGIKFGGAFFAFCKQMNVIISNIVVRDRCYYVISQIIGILLWHNICCCLSTAIQWSPVIGTA